MNPGTYYVPEGEERTLTIIGVQQDGSDPEPLAFIDGSALFLLCTVREAESDKPLMLKQYGASRLLLAGLNPDQLDPGQEVVVKRWEDGGYEVDTDPSDFDADDSAADVM